MDFGPYFERIGDTGDRSPTLATLARLQYAHAMAIPFENLDIHLGRQIRIDLDSVTEKLVHNRRGGYCFEQNTLFAAVLESLGFSVTRLAARVRLGRPGMVTARTHMLLAVEGDGRRWISDVGFGGGTPLCPVPLADDEPASCGRWRWRLVKQGDWWVLQLDQPAEAGGWLDLYAFTEEEHHAIDFEVANHYTATSPASIFVQALTAQQPGPEVQVGLRGRELTEFHPDGRTVRKIEDDDELLGVLAERFRLAFPAGTRFVSPSRAATGA